MSRTTGALRKMVAVWADPVEYHLPVGEASIALRDALGRTIALEFSGEIHCTHCGRATRRSFAQGHCWPCFTTLARCDGCIVKPELCHFHRGTCREPAWGQAHCMAPHVVYLANSSGLKVGITRGDQVRSRWIDQGAVQGLAIREVETRLESGVVEVALKALVSDRTDWRRLLRGDPEPVDLVAAARDLLARLAERQPELALPGRTPAGAAPVSIRYPVLRYPERVRRLDPARSPRIEGQLLGVKGQYLILDAGVINVRKYGGYAVTLRGLDDARRTRCAEEIDPSDLTPPAPAATPSR